jgi:murein DD-endopeptidase MepM/ murein hydrolase activator NlpD
VLGLILSVSPACQTTVASEASEITYTPKRAVRHLPHLLQQKKVEALIFPTQSTTISSLFGRRWGRKHQGIDITAPMGSPIYAVKSGRSEFVGKKRGYGLTVVIRHKKFKTLYAHCKKAAISPGSLVKRGQIIGYVGMSGNAEGPHLHFELHTLDNHPLNPLAFLHQSTLAKSLPSR